MACVGYCQGLRCLPPPLFVPIMMYIHYVGMRVYRYVNSTVYVVFIINSGGGEETSCGLGSGGSRREGSRSFRTENSNRGHHEEVRLRVAGLVPVRGGSRVVGFLYDHGNQNGEVKTHDELLQEKV
jgi:hypothetical protein